MPEGLYPGDYLVPVGQALARDQHGDDLLAMDEADWLPLVKNAAIDAMMDLIRNDLAQLGVSHDVFLFRAHACTPTKRQLDADRRCDCRPRSARSRL